MWAFGGKNPEFAYKLYVFLSAALIPWLVALAGWSWGLRINGVALAVLLFLAYVWTDFPINYAAFGMLPYLLAVPLGLLATGLFCRFLTDGGFVRWLGSVILLSATVLFHFTSAMIVVPAAALAYLASLRGHESRHPEELSETLNPNHG